MRASLAAVAFATAPLMASSAWAQTGTEPLGSAGGAAGDRQIRVMEQALEQAVGRGITAVEQQLPSVVPGLLFFAGSIQARGFVLDGYGVFFDVEYPAVRRSILWSMGALNQFDAGMANAVASLRRQLLTMPDGPARVALRDALRELEAQLRPTPPTPVPLGRGDASRSTTSDGRAAPESPSQVDPVALYQAALSEALVETVVILAAEVPSAALGDDAWLTVAARDGRSAHAGPATRSTLVLRVRGQDLAAHRRGRLTAEALRARIEVR